MNLMADECIDRQIVDHLRKDGHEVLYVPEMDPGIPDDTILERTRRNSSLLMTTDKDFGELVFRQKRISSGVMLLRLAGLRQADKAEIVSSVIRTRSNELCGSFTVVSPGTVRIRKTL